MLKDKTRQLPKELRIERLSKMALACRFGWHQWVWSEPLRHNCGKLRGQEKTCARCGRAKWSWA